MADSLPLLSMDAERAAAKLIRATLRGRPEVVLTPAAKIAVRLHGVAPTTLRVVSALNRLLPFDETRTPLAPGHRVGRRGPVFNALTGLASNPIHSPLSWPASRATCSSWLR